MGNKRDADSAGRARPKRKGKGETRRLPPGVPDPVREKDWKPAFLAAFRSCGDIQKAAQGTGVTRQAVHWNVKHKPDDPFSKEVVEIQEAYRAEWAAELEGKMWRRALDGEEYQVVGKDGDVHTLRRHNFNRERFLLEKCNPERFGSEPEQGQAPEEQARQLFACLRAMEAMQDADRPEGV